MAAMAGKSARSSLQRYRVLVSGIVQGVGFRPFVYQLAKRLRLSGHVGNDGLGVFIEIEGPAGAIDSFLDELQNRPPPLARIDNCQWREITAHNCADFEIVQSQSTDVSTHISPDASVCRACVSELFDPASRFYHYPFLNCTHCGPRYTITQKLPYDRPNTAMKQFSLCHDCHRDYHDPTDRRYHAQPIACPACGPELTASPDDMARTINDGGIVAVKALGGYQLICDANHSQAVARLRQRKQRDSKPWALMVLNTASARYHTSPDREHDKLLQRADNPIVLLPKKDSTLPDAIAPGLDKLGIMLPYTPLHYLLFHYLTKTSDCLDSWLKNACKTVLVVTSANAHGSPIINDNAVAQKELEGIADRVVHHNRPIVTRVDDSVAQVVNQKPIWVRRARGNAPRRIELPCELPSTLAVGGFLKNTVCLTRGREAFVSQHIGDLDHPETASFFEHTIDHMSKLLNIQPQMVACDSQPDSYAYHKAHTMDLPCYAVTHHYAHIASVMAEHHLEGDCLGLALDGFGLGEDGGFWGGELIMGRPGSFKRVGHLRPIRLPGGDQAARHPWRVAAAVLKQLGYSALEAQTLLGRQELSKLWPIIDNDRLSPPTSSCGRLFDAASALLNVCQRNDFEGRAPMLLEAHVNGRDHLPAGSYNVGAELDVLPCFIELARLNAFDGARLFHGTVAQALADWVTQAGREHALKQVVLAGGCFFNQVLTEALTDKLQCQGFEVFFPMELPVNDGGLCLGQAWQAYHLSLKHQGA